MAERHSPTINDIDIAKPIHVQRLETSLDVAPFLNYVDQVMSQSLSDTDDSSDSDAQGPGDVMLYGDKLLHGVVTTREERRSDKLRLYNFTNVGPDRRWLQETLISDSDTSDSDGEVNFSEEYLQDLLKMHLRTKKCQAKYYSKPNHIQYQYYATGLLSNYDRFLEHQQSIVGVKKKIKRERKSEKKPSKSSKKQSLKIKTEPEDDMDFNNELDWEEKLLSLKDEPEDYDDIKPGLSPFAGLSSKAAARSRKKAQLAKTPEVMAARRRKIWQLMSKKELGKVQRAKANNHKEYLTSCKRIAGLCMKMYRQKAMQSQKNMKETVWRAKRLTREMQAYWKRYDRVERETRRRMEKEAEEQRKMDVELIEAKRQQRKLNFLITQTELYAHFMSRKLGTASPEEQLRILNQLDEEKNPRLAAIDDYDCEVMKQIAQKNAAEAFNTERQRTRQFDAGAAAKPLSPIIPPEIEDQPQPDIFHGSLKGYQIKGMTWLANLYDQGISGILADEMGLGKTVQSIAFLCHVAEKYGVWGPFLIISPASTLHNWQQEMARFVPDFKVVPYWGSPNERKILRQFWDQKDLHTKEASFHVVITSYQLVISDYKYFNRIKWQYMILDEAQAIKSTSSVRWKLLLGFNCRNRLLLSGTPIQNSMAELWALLHFIMPTLFDSHDEFNEWFSKDIESHAENKTGIDEKHLSRLHMILKPFMLRRIKKDVENELSDKIEIMVYCPLTTRQKLLYIALKQKIRIEDLLHYTVGGGDGGHSVDKNFTSSLMNLVMQFRKVCNHPELFERRDAKSPFAMKCDDYKMPVLIFDDGTLERAFPSKHHILYNKLNIFKADYVHKSIFHSIEESTGVVSNTCFSFSRFIDMAPKEIEGICLQGLIYFWLNVLSRKVQNKKVFQRRIWWDDINWNTNAICLKNILQQSEFTALGSYNRNNFSILRDLVFTANASRESTVYTHTDHVFHSMQETMEHRIIRSKNVKITELDVDVEMPLDDPSDADMKSPKTSRKDISKMNPEDMALLPEFHHFPRDSRVDSFQATDMPPFLYGLSPKIQTVSRRIACSKRAAEWANIRHDQCDSIEGMHLVVTGGVDDDTTGGLQGAAPKPGWSNIIVPDKETLVSDAGKLSVLDTLLTRLKAQGHRVLIYSQMTKMIDLLEEFMWHRKHKYMRLDGSSKISARRDMVADFQARADIFVFLLSTRAGGLGINLTAADTVIFYDSDWNPTVDQQAMDRAHRLGQTKQVTVYRLICKGSIEERILQRAREKSEIQRMVISGGNFKPDTLKPKEVVSLLLDDEEIELKYRQKTEERRNQEELRADFIRERDRERKRKQIIASNKNNEGKRQRLEELASTSSSQPSTSSGTVIPEGDAAWMNLDSAPVSPTHSEGSLPTDLQEETSNEGMVVDVDSPMQGSPVPFPPTYGLGKPRRRHHPRGTKRGRPRGSRRGAIAGSQQSRTPEPGSSPVQMSPMRERESIPSSIISSTHSMRSINPVRRGPGRPRLKHSGPAHQGARAGGSRPRKPAGPLPVPLGSGHGTPSMSPAHDNKPFGFYQAASPDDDVF